MTCHGPRHRVTYPQRHVRCRTCGIRTERVAFAEGHARITHRLRQVIGLDCQSMPTSHAAVRHGVSWSKARRHLGFLCVLCVPCGDPDDYGSGFSNFCLIASKNALAMAE